MLCIIMICSLIVVLFGLLFLIGCEDMMVVGLLLNNVDVYVIILVEIKDDFDEVLVVLVFLL